MTEADLLASIAGVCTTLSFLPQVIKIFRTKHTKDLSLPMYMIFVSGVFLWFVYGMLIGSWPVVMANGVTFALSAYILAMKVRYK